MTDSVGRLKHTSFRHQTLHLVASNYVALLQRLDGEVLARQLVLGQQYLQITVAMLHSNGQLRTQRYGDRGRSQKPALQHTTIDDDDAKIFQEIAIQKWQK